MDYLKIHSTVSRYGSTHLKGRYTHMSPVKSGKLEEPSELTPAKKSSAKKSVAKKTASKEKPAEQVRTELAQTITSALSPDTAPNKNW